MLPWARARGDASGQATAASSGGPAPSSAPSSSGAAAPGPVTRGPVVTAVSAIAAGLPYRADLSADSPLRLLYLAAAASATGRLDLGTDRGRFVLEFRRGVLAQVSSDAAVDGLGPYLVRRGALSPESLARADGVRERFGGDLVSALASFDAFRAARDLTLLQDHAVGVVARAIASERGTVSWTAGSAAATGSGFPLAPRWGLVCEATRRLDPDAVRRLLGDRLRRVASPTRGRVELSELRIVPQEARAAGLFDGTASPAQLTAQRPGEAATILKVAYLLAETELLQFGALAPEPVRKPAPTPLPRSAAAPVPAAAPPPAPPRRAAPAPPSTAPGRTPEAMPAAPGRTPEAMAPAPAPEDREALEAFHRKIATANHFEVLGAPRTATTAQLKAAYFQLAKRYHPDAGAPGEPAPVKKLRAEIFARIGEAWGVLGDERDRAEYVRQLESGTESEVDVAHILKAEEIFRRVTVLARARQYQQALTTLEEAIALNPDEPEFGVWRAWLRFLLATDRDAQRTTSAAAIEKALEKAPRCVAGYLFLAQMARNMGDVDSAERHLKRGLGVAPHHEELVRELKFLELKRK